MFKNGQGEHRKKLAEDNKKRIAKWIKDNPGKTRKQCCQDLGICYNTLRKHVKELQA